MKNPLKKWLLRNWTVKMITLILAIAIWYLIDLSRNDFNLTSPPPADTSP